jgi:hypothetical protein
LATAGGQKSESPILALFAKVMQINLIGAFNLLQRLVMGRAVVADEP